MSKLVLPLGVLSAALLAAQAQARTFECEDRWSNASAANKPEQCFTDGSHLQKVLFGPDHIGYVILAIIPLVLLVFVLLCWPITFFLRCCGCCGGRRRTPDAICCGDTKKWEAASEEEKQAAYPPGSVRRTKFCAGFVLFIIVAAMPFGFWGTAALNTEYDAFFSDAKGLIGWIDDQGGFVKRLMTINSTGELIEPLTDQVFYDIGNTTADFSQQLDDAKNSADEYALGAVTASYFLFATVLLCPLFVVAAACCNCRALALVNLLSYLFFLVFGIGATVFLLIGLVFADVCGEREKFINDPTAPGLFSYSLVPICQDTVPFESVPGQVREVIVTQANKSCSKMGLICSVEPEYDSSAHPDEVYHCPTLTDPDSACTTFVQANSYSQTLVLKTNVTQLSCENNSVPVVPCTMAKCGEFCNVSSIRNTSYQANENLLFAQNAEIAFNVFVVPLLSCVNIYNQVLRPLKSCTAISNAIYTIGGASLAVEIGLAMLMVVIMRGSKRFFAPAPKPTKTDEPYGVDDSLSFSGEKKPAV